jgi:hypothetical protein
MGQAGGTQESLKPAAILSFVCYTLGLPLAFLTILLRHRVAIRADQTLRLANDGGSEATNPNFHIRRRYQELYRWGVTGDPPHHSCFVCTLQQARTHPHWSLIVFSQEPTSFAFLSSRFQVKTRHRLT